jgi:hypothetical protein
MPLEPEEFTPEQKLFSMTDKVVIVRGVIPSDSTIWEFHIQGKVLRVDTDRLENMTQFRQQYLKAFDRPAPKIKLSRWSYFLEALADDKAIYAQAPEESRPVFIARHMLEIVCDREASDDAEGAFSGFSLYKHVFKDDEKVYYCMPSKVFLALVDGAGFKIPPNELSSAMTELGLKKNGTPRVSYCGKQERSWCFIQDVVLRNKGEQLDD